MPKINEILLKLEGFQYSMSLDLNIGYYHIRLSENATNLCMVILPLGKISLKTFTNERSQITKHFPTENE